MNEQASQKFYQGRRKFYVQSGDLQYICLAASQLEACLMSIEHEWKGDIRLANEFSVDERGFRERFSATYNIPTDTVFAEMEKYE